MAKILLVEDERVIRAEIKRILTREQHEVTDVPSVREAECACPEGFAPDMNMKKLADQEARVSGGSIRIVAVPATHSDPIRPLIPI